MSNLYISEQYFNIDEQYCYADGPIYETAYTDVGSLYRALQKMYGRCTGKIMSPCFGQQATAVGWIFRSRVKYEGGNDTFLREVWVTVHESEPERKVTYHYKRI